MKKGIVAIICLFTAFGLYSQYWGGGAVGGFSVNQVDGDQLGGYKKLGLVAGVYAHYDFNDKASLQPEILFSQRGARESNEVLFYHFRGNYIDVPVLFSYKVWEGSGNKLRLEIGPQPGALIGATVATFNKNNKQEVSSFLKRFNLDAVAGIDFYTNSKVSFNVRAGYSMLRANKDQSGSPLSYRGGWWHRYIQFTLRYDLKPGGR